jgi:hypothetical protein
VCMPSFGLWGGGGWGVGGRGGGGWGGVLLTGAEGAALSAAADRGRVRLGLSAAPRSVRLPLGPLCSLLAVRVGEGAAEGAADGGGTADSAAEIDFADLARRTPVTPARPSDAALASLPVTSTPKESFVILSTRLHQPSFT